MGTAAAASERGGRVGVWVVRVVCGGGQVDPRRSRRRCRATLARADGLQHGSRGVGRRRRGVGDVGLQTRDNGASDGDMDRTAGPDSVRLVGGRRPGGGRAPTAARRQDGLLPKRLDVERQLSGRGTLREVPRAGHRRRRVGMLNRVLILIISMLVLVLFGCNGFSPVAFYGE